jgi:serine/alanine adding enzyme
MGTPVLPGEFFEEAASGMSQEIVVGVVFRRGQAVAAGCGFLWRGELEVTWSGAVKEVRRIRPNMLLLWSFMEEAFRRGAHTFNFGRSTPESGTHQFKRQWGGRDQPLPWAQWAPGSVRATPTPTGTKYRVATAIWRRMPLSVTNRLGPMISRSLP